MTLTLGDGPRSGSPPDANYSEPLDETLKARDHIAFAGDGITVEVDGEQVE